MNASRAPAQLDFIIIVTSRIGVLIRNYSVVCAPVRKLSPIRVQRENHPVSHHFLTPCSSRYPYPFSPPALVLSKTLIRRRQKPCVTIASFSHKDTIPEKNRDCERILTVIVGALLLNFASKLQITVQCQKNRY